MIRTVISQQIQFDETGLYLIIKYSDGSISSEPVSSEFAAEWSARNSY